MDILNIIAGIITLSAFIFSIYIYLKDKILTKSIESGLIGLIHNLDVAAYNCNERSSTKKELAGQIESARNQAISVLKSFSDREVRFNTFSFGLNGKEMNEIIKERKEKVGVKYKGCIVEGQNVKLKDQDKIINEVKPGENVLSYDLNSNQIEISKVIRNGNHIIENHIEINGNLRLTANNEIWIKDRGWVMSSELTVGDLMMKSSESYEMIRSINFVDTPARVYDINVHKNNNLFVNDTLVHNKI